MVDRLKVETILTRRFPGATDCQIAAAANALMGLSDEWEEVERLPERLVEERPELRIFRRRREM